jgi:hypothetical protein
MTDWPDIAHTYDAVARDYAAKFADELAGLLSDAGLTVEQRHRRDPYPDEYPTPRLYLLARRPG